MTLGPNCPGVRMKDAVRPIAELCQPCACWLRTAGPVIAPNIVVRYGDDAKPILMCTRREPVIG